MRNYNSKTIQGDWIEFDNDVAFKLRPFRLDNMIHIPNSKREVSIEEKKKIFDYCVLDWKGLTMDNKELKCNDENKDLVFNLDREILIFVLNSIEKLGWSLGEEVKN